ncbi:MAG: hypothetical protein IJZ53_00930 [Tyzzerella sp.]|nr:hypothetical protein [Tyzzerella sp.]
MVTDVEVAIYHYLWNYPKPIEFPIDIYIGNQYITLWGPEWEEIQAKVAEEQYQEYLKEANNNAG